MSRSDTRDDAHRSIREATGTGRHSSLANAVKRDARQFLNTAEYEFRKVVGASRTPPAPQEPSQARARKTPEADRM